MPASKRARRSERSVVDRDGSPTQEKNEEELELEAVLFGKKRKPVSAAHGKGKGVERNRPGMTTAITNEDESSDEEMAEMEDKDVSYGKPMRGGGVYVLKRVYLLPQLFVLDDMPGISTSAAYADSSSEEESDQDDSNVDEGESDEDSAMSRSERAGSSASSSSSSSSISQNISPDTGTAPSTRKKALWHDPADELVSVTLADDKRLRKLARGKEGQDSKVQGKDLEKKLRGQ